MPVQVEKKTLKERQKKRMREDQINESKTQPDDKTQTNLTYHKILE